ncbi:MAG: tyrosine-type recombinase/integrase [Pseudomonadales bacterium]|nr:tyrosine-type recombinase/integrase [Pseudomonadales bacterium]
MPRIAKPLTDTQIRNAKPKSKEYNLADGQGLYLRVKQSGSKEWVFNYYKPISGKRTNKGLGIYPNVSLKVARDKRQIYQDLLAEGHDPAEYLAKKKNEQASVAANTLRKVTELWLETRTDITARYARDIKSSLTTHVMPSLGHIPITDITPVMAINAIRPLAEQGKSETVSRVCSRLIRIMGFAKNTGLVEENRLYGIKDAFKSPKHKNFPTIAPSELPDFIQQLSRASITLTTRLLIEFQLHTMVRPGEAAGARWSEIDFDNALWIIPGTRMKKGRQHIVPLTKQCLAILSEMEVISNQSEYVFPADRRGKGHVSAATANMAIKRMGYKGRLVSHGLRALASTTLNEQGFRPDIIEVALAHGDKDKVRDSYNHAEFLQQRGEMMAWWSNHIESPNLKLKGVRNVAIEV